MKKSLEHRGMLAILIDENYRKLRIGQVLMKIFIESAQNNILIEKVD
ncbi:hypothetical protein OSO01_26940 [Oceanobacillus sojae]|uniref:Uncharacterized protein n=1 Tax=Oceanobacillus sojae TaxID=582851 RepID=A0A511ZKJ9_9BACI|nr:hypothetical protein OSO01_26940 [Oceanobacillus sojae]